LERVLTSLSLQNEISEEVIRVTTWLCHFIQHLQEGVTCNKAYKGLKNGPVHSVYKWAENITSWQGLGVPGAGIFL
jgi:hypothetical protein